MFIMLVYVEFEYNDGTNTEMEEFVGLFMKLTEFMCVYCVVLLLV
jgi:hypothetical protein